MSVHLGVCGYVLMLFQTTRLVGLPCRSQCEEFSLKYAAGITLILRVLALLMIECVTMSILFH